MLAYSVCVCPLVCLPQPARSTFLSFFLIFKNKQTKRCTHLLQIAKLAFIHALILCHAFVCVHHNLVHYCFTKSRYLGRSVRAIQNNKTNKVQQRTRQ